MLRYLMLIAALWAASPLALPAEARPKRAPSLQVVSRPAGAEVLIDGAPAGATPLKMEAPAPGQYQVELRKAGYETVVRTVTVRATGKTRVRAKLRKVRSDINPRDRDAIRSAAAAAGSRLRALSAIARLYLQSSPGGGFASDDEPAYDPFLGLYFTVEIEENEDGDFLITVRYTEDEEGLLPAGALEVLLAERSTLHLEIIAGRFAGLTSHQTVEPDLSGGARLTMQGSMPGGASYEGEYRYTLEEKAIAWTGESRIVDGDWSARVTVEGSTLTGQRLQAITSDGLTINLQTALDGSSTGEVLDTATGALLATIVVNAAGQGTITYADGTQEQFNLFQPF